MPKGYPRYVLGVMVGINFLNYMDRYIGAAAAPLIQRDFRLSDFQLGLLATAFLLVYAVTAVLFGYWADRGVRKVVIGVGVTLWSLATLVSGLVANFTQLFLSRILLGVGEAGYYPAGTALISDYFPKASRDRASSIWGAGTALGIAVGFAGGGYVAERYGWRSAFFFAAAPGLLFAVLAFTLREPLRGAAEPRGPCVRVTRDAGLSALLGLLRIPTLRWTILSQTCLFFVLTANSYWLPTALNRRFGMSVSKAALLAGVVIVLAGLVGNLLGGTVSDRLSRRSEKGPLQVGVAGFLVAAVFIAIALLAPLNVGLVPVFVPAFFITVVGLYLYSGPFTAVSQTVVTPGLRASSVTMLLFVAHVLGDSHSTADVGWISDRLHNLTLALLVTSTPMLLLAAFFGFPAMRTVGADTSQSEDTWARQEAEPAPVPSFAP